MDVTYEPAETECDEYVLELSQFVLRNERSGFDDENDLLAALEGELPKSAKRAH